MAEAATVGVWAGPWRQKPQLLGGEGVDRETEVAKADYSSAVLGPAGPTKMLPRKHHVKP